MYITPSQAAVAAVLAITLVVVVFLCVAELRTSRKQNSQQDTAPAVTHDFTRPRRAIEPDHLVDVPAVGTNVVLIEDSSYLYDYHGARAGQVGTVVRHSRLNSHDNGVLVDWGMVPNDGVRMDLRELRLAPSDR